ncbi:MAG TPA: alpha-amylase family protein [Bryobacteraceae bacterium]|nr:alpha-amylase family protein [Bryobacteraceae bacterium]
MTRRDCAKLAALAALRVPVRAAVQVAAPRIAPLPRAKWVENGIIDAGGSHEPYTFVVRRGGQRLDARQEYEHAQSEELIRRLKNEGVEVFHTHLYKGAGMAHERAEMEDARRVAAIAHKHGLRVDSYIQWDTMIYEPFFVEEPRAQEWIQRDANGQPIMLIYGFQQSYRYRPCFSNPDYLDYLKKIVRFAVEEVKTDLIHFDNFDLNPEPESCHCRWCVAGFREFLRRKYTDAGRKERFGFANTDYVNPPRWNRSNPPEEMEIIFDPAIQEWIDYRCQSMADALGTMARLIKSLNPEVAVEVNPHGITGGNRAWQAGLDHARFLRYTEAFWSEERNVPAVHPDGRIISTIRSYKLARAFQNTLFTYIALDQAAMAEALAFNQTLGTVGDPGAPDMRRYIAFYKQNRELYSRAVDAGNVALLRSYPSITYHNARAQLGAVLVEQALIQAKIPFDLVFDEHLQDLTKYRVLILPESQCLSDAQLVAIRRFVEGGGGLVATGMAGLYDHWRRLRVTPGLAGMVAGQRPARAYQEQVEREEESGVPSRSQYGGGRVVYFPAVPFDGPLPEMEPYFTISSRHFWKAPTNWREIAKAVRWAARGGVPLEVGGPEYLIANLTAHPSRRQTVIHLVNYGYRQTPSIKQIPVRYRLPEGGRFREARLVSPDFPGSRTLSAKVAEGMVEFTLPELKVYSAVVLGW